MSVCPKSGKHCYRSPSHARRVMRKLSAALRVYKCPACGSYHMTKKHGS